MKMIIDIDEETYNRAKNEQSIICGMNDGLIYKSNMKEAIANGIPYEERPQGEWIYGEDDCGQDGWFCSECNFFVPWYYQYYEKDIDFIRDYKACPHCLAEMITYTGKDRDMKGGAE